MNLTYGSPAVKAFTKRPLTTPTLYLPFPMGNVISNGIAKNVIESLGLRNIRASFPNNGNHFTFIVKSCALLSQRMNWDWV